MYISNIIIKNFRSINEASIDLSDISVFVGNNDAGKSNILRAMNLFFNNETDPGVNFDFNNDFYADWDKSSKKAKEIRIALKINPPATYKASGTVLWEKSWRADGISDEWMGYSPDKEFEGRSKLPAWLSKIRFYYIPAIKGKDYFSRLMTEIYKTLNRTIEKEIHDASLGFVESINRHTATINSYAMSNLGLDTKLQLPLDLTGVFSSLEMASSVGAGKTLSLNQRGDGIKVSHIPLVLKFISEQHNKNFDKGSIKAVSIWGYEEPENNLELGKCYEMANRFVEYSDDIQMLLTTHSPAFYGLRNIEKACCYRVKKDSLVTSIHKAGNASDLDEEMGIMPLVEPYIAKQVEKIQSMQAELKKNTLPIVYVEGATEHYVLSKELDKADKNWKTKFDVINCKSANGVADYAIAHLLLKPKLPALVLCDEDDSGRDTHSKITQHSRYSAAKLKSIKYSEKEICPAYVIEIKRKIGAFDIELEHLFGMENFQNLSARRYTEQSKNPCSDKVPLNQSLLEFYKSKNLNSIEITFVTHQIKQDKKMDFAKESTQKGDMETVNKIIKLIYKHFEIDTACDVK